MEEELDMEITHDTPNRFVLVTDEGEQLHVFRVPAGTVLHITDPVTDVTQAILIDDDSIPFLLRAISRLSGVTADV